MHGRILFFATLCISTYNASLFVEWFTTGLHNTVFTTFVHLRNNI